MFKLCYINFTLSSRTQVAAPLQYAYKLNEFIKLVIPDDENEQLPNFDKLKELCSRGSLFFI
jgi:hypothetical protein